MKNLLILALVCILTISVMGCSQTSKYYIEENGSYYLVLDNLPIVPSYDNVAALVNPLPHGIYFDSIDEMRKRIQSAEFNEEELWNIAFFDQDSQGRILMLDLSKIYVPYHPSAITGYKIWWSGDSYEYSISSNLGDLYMHLHTSVEGLNFTYESNAPKNGYVETEKSKKLTRSFTDADSTYRIIETYTYSVSKEFPSRIEVFVERNNQYFGIKLSGLQGPVTDEFLTQFEYRLYTD